MIYVIYLFLIVIFIKNIRYKMSESKSGGKLSSILSLNEDSFKSIKEKPSDH